ncbi:MAG: outer membrane beta-barrel domain-containing protein [Pseudomonadota bacterium]
MNRRLTMTYRLTLALVLSLAGCLAYAQSDPPVDGETDSAILNEIITPDIERRRIKQSQLDSEDWEIGIYGGVFSIEDFGSNSIVGLRFAYHMTEDFVVELNYGVTDAQESSIEVLGGGIRLLTDDQREYSYYNVSLVYNLFPGEIFLGRKKAFNSSFYLLAGAGNTTFNENDYFTYTIGGGLRFYLTDAIALHFTAKDHIFRNDIIEDKLTNNLEGSLGLSFYF